MATIPAQRRQVSRCESCDAPLPGLLATCDKPGCVAAWIADAVREDQRIEAGDE